MIVEEQLRAIYQGQIERLDEAVSVRCHPISRGPVGFVWRGVWHPVDRILEWGRDDLDSNIDIFLVSTESEEVFALCRRPGSPGRGCWWWLYYRVLRSEELGFFDRRLRRMLVDLELKRMADMNGHLCPDLAIGWRVGLVARTILQDDGEIVAGCMSCAVEALKNMGPWRLKVDMAQGRHMYQVRSGKDICVNLEVSERFTWPDGDLALLEQRVSRHEASLEEIAAYQARIDEQIQEILSATDHELFSDPEQNRLLGVACIGSA